MANKKYKVVVKVKDYQKDIYDTWNKLKDKKVTVRLYARSEDDALSEAIFQMKRQGKQVVSAKVTR